MKEIFDNILKETITLNNVRYDYSKNFLNVNSKEKLKINYSEETKELFTKFKPTDEEKESANKPRKDKAIGKASQRRGNGRGCI